MSTMAPYEILFSVLGWILFIPLSAFFLRLSTLVFEIKDKSFKKPFKIVLIISFIWFIFDNFIVLLIREISITLSLSVFILLYGVLAIFLIKREYKIKKTKTLLSVWIMWFLFSLFLLLAIGLGIGKILTLLGLSEGSVCEV